MAGTKAPIADMRPTQLTLGLSEVAERAAKIAAMTPADREAHLERKPVPHVLGPGKKIYIVDHHHLARALWSLKIPEAVLGDRVADWSGLEPKAFWRMMESKGYCWPIDADGNRRPYAAIPALQSATSPTTSGARWPDECAARRSKIWTRRFRNSCGETIFAHS
jgi:hypothetical protein